MYDFIHVIMIMCIPSFQDNEDEVVGLNNPPSKTALPHIIPLRTTRKRSSKDDSPKAGKPKPSKRTKKEDSKSEPKADKEAEEMEVDEVSRKKYSNLDIILRIYLLASVFIQIQIVQRLL